ncbi:MAG: phosphate--AMP phosphotransferase, partial [Fusobacteriaceae bacterium]
NDLRGARAEVYRILVENLNIRIENKLVEPNDLSLPYRKHISLDKVDLNKKLSKEEYNEKIKKLQDKIYLLQHQLHIEKVPVVIAYEGWDAGGKGGNIRRLVERMDPRAYDVIPVAAPNDYERKKHYLWRFWRFFPEPGHITIFDRTWYGRVLVERVEGFAHKYEWKRAFKEIGDMERQCVDDGAVVIKFWLHISPEEQLNRFNERKNSPDKNWKITEEDWRNREKWAEYKKAVEEMITRTSESYAPWYIIPANDKYYARVFALETVVKTLEKKLKDI